MTGVSEQEAQLEREKRNHKRSSRKLHSKQAEPLIKGCCRRLLDVGAIARARVDCRLFFLLRAADEQHKQGNKQVELSVHPSRDCNRYVICAASFFNP
jgi:hypothetical protein